MASHRGSAQSEPAKNEQLITEFFPKSLQIILESRYTYVSSRNYSGELFVSSPSSSSSSTSSISKRDKWFNLALKECPPALENIDLWRQSSPDPMVIDVILVQRSSNWDPVSCSPRRGLVRNLSSKGDFPNFWNSDHNEFGCESKTEKIIERWVVQYESQNSVRHCSSGSKRSSGTGWSTLYKKATLLLRSLYAMVRLLPAYKLFRDLTSSGQFRTFNLAHRVSSFVEPFTHQEESEMQQFVFTPVDTFCGRLCLSVVYRSSFLDVISEPSTPMTPQFIPDYVGSPMADPLKRFPSIPVHQGSPSFSPFGRRHSWSYDLYRAAPPSALPSPSPTYSDCRALISKRSSHCIPRSNLPLHVPETHQLHKNNRNFDDYWPSPIFSPSPSSSPPVYFAGSHVPRALLRSESDPLKIPAYNLPGTPSSKSKRILPSPSLECTRPETSKTGISGLVRTSSNVDKFCSPGKTEAGRCSGVKMSSESSPQKPVSRSSSRLSIQDDFDDSDFSGHFLVSDDDMTGVASRRVSFDLEGHLSEPLEPGGLFQGRKSQDAALGHLVHMLKKGQPLRQDTLNVTVSDPFEPPTLTNIQEQNKMSREPADQNAPSSSAAASSSHLLPRTTADALEELQGYIVMKDSLLRQGTRSDK